LLPLSSEIIDDVYSVGLERIDCLDLCGRGGPFQPGSGAMRIIACRGYQPMLDRILMHISAFVQTMRRRMWPGHFEIRKLVSA
jgi:hypothetical protein